MSVIELYTTITCPYCDRAKELLTRKGVTFHEIDVSDDLELRAFMQKRAQGQRTVPQIFIGDYHVGGYTDLYALEQSGKLSELLADV